MGMFTGSRVWRSPRIWYLNVSENGIYHPTQPLIASEDAPVSSASCCALSVSGCSTAWCAKMGFAWWLYPYFGFVKYRALKVNNINSWWNVYRNCPKETTDGWLQSKRPVDLCIFPRGLQVWPPLDSSCLFQSFGGESTIILKFITNIRAVYIPNFSCCNPLCGWLCQRLNAQLQSSRFDG